MTQLFTVAITDIYRALVRLPLAGLLGWQDLRQRYRRSTLGPFWLTISQGVMIGMMGVLFSQIFKTEIEEFLPFIAIGMIMWGYISSTIIESGMVFVASEGIIKQLPIPIFTHVLRMMWRNILIFGHNLLIVPLVLLAVQKSLGWVALWSIPGFILVTVNLTWIVLLFGILCTRYRDMPQIVASLVQVVFFLTPIMWMPKLLPERTGAYLLDFNPFYHLLSIVREPILGAMPSLLNWGVSLGLAVAGWGVALLFYGRYKARVPYWL
ncbi:MAG: ABC transporter permease [Burkholderiales bacterium]|jgi:lipopolysaccharide transport system permease protein|nr:ABC transporter permease [Burkholderiales bacterium]